MSGRKWNKGTPSKPGWYDVFVDPVGLPGTGPHECCARLDEDGEWQATAFTCYVTGWRELSPHHIDYINDHFGANLAKPVGS